MPKQPRLTTRQPPRTARAGAAKKAPKSTTRKSTRPRAYMAHNPMSPHRNMSTIRGGDGSSNMCQTLFGCWASFEEWYCPRRVAARYGGRDQGGEQDGQQEQRAIEIPQRMPTAMEYNAGDAGLPPPVESLSLPDQQSTAGAIDAPGPSSPPEQVNKE